MRVPGPRLLDVFLVVCDFGASDKLRHLEDWFADWFPQAVVNAGAGVGFVYAWVLHMFGLGEGVFQRPLCCWWSASPML